MATQCMTESCYPQMQLPSGFSIVVDDVDGDQDPIGEEEVDDDVVEEAQEALALDGEVQPCQCGTMCSAGVRRGSRDMCSERIRQIQVEAQSRKNEFAKLLEEHAQVVMRVKQMEQREHQQHPHHQDHDHVQDQQEPHPQVQPQPCPNNRQ